MVILSVLSNAITKQNLMYVFSCVVGHRNKTGPSVPKGSVFSKVMHIRSNVVQTHS